MKKKTKHDGRQPDRGRRGGGRPGGKREHEEARPSGRYESVLSVNSRGVGYAPIPGFDEDIEIENHFLKTALNGDTVEIALHPKVKNQRRRGEVVKIVSRARLEFVGTVDKTGGACFVVPDDRKMYQDIVLLGAEAEKVRHGDKAFVRIDKWTSQKLNPVGAVLKSIGKKGSHEVEMQSIILEKGIVYDFPAEVEEEAGRLARAWHPIPADEAGKRRDFRDVTTFTIDPADAKDFDDALSFKRLGGGRHEIGVHIADVSHYVREGTALDKEARKRGFSVYLVDRTIPMLPEVLSNDLCSLNPEEDKLAFSAVFVLDDKGKVHERWFGKAIIRSDKRFSYEEAQKTLDDGSGPYLDELQVLNRLAKRLMSERFKKGAIDFDTTEVKFRLDPEGRPVDVYEKPRLDTHKLIEEFMLLANREVAEHILRLDKDLEPRKGPSRRPFIYRIHDLPNKDKVEELGIFVRALGFELGRTGREVSPFDISKLLEDVENSSQESLIKTAAIRSMAKAVYSARNIGHFGLAFKHYTHFTSPIRRYPDLVAHRLLWKYLGNPKSVYDDFAKYEKIAMEASQRELTAVEAERASVKYKQVEYMKDKVGEEFDAYISGVTEWGIYVEEAHSRAEGMVRIRDLDGGDYEVDEKTYSLVGSRGKKRYSLGDKVRVRLTGADLDRKTLDFKFVG